MKRDTGYSVLEMVVAMAIMAGVTGSLFGLLNPARAASAVQPEAADMQQRLRVAVDMLSKDLLMAGAGTYADAPRVALSYYAAPVLPYRTGAIGAEPGGTFRPDVITLLSVPSPDPGCADHSCVAGRTYFLRSDPVRKLYQLMAYDGGVNADVPVVDHVVGLRFEYLGDADVALTPAELTDGPWLPDAASPVRFDADLLRIRAIRVTLRLESGNDALRGPAGLLFARGGTGVDAATLLPDQACSFEVAPRNLNLDR